MAKKLLCSACEQEKDISEFYKHIRNKSRGYTYKCKECLSKENKDKYISNAETMRQSGLESYHRNKDKHTERVRLRGHSTRNPSIYNQQMRAWKKHNAEKVRATTQRGKALRRQAEGSFTLDEWQALCDYCGNKCLACGGSKPLTVDHIVPVSKGGSNYISNIQPLCGSCNSSKGDRTIDYRTY